MTRRLGSHPDSAGSDDVGDVALSGLINSRVLEDRDSLLVLVVTIRSLSTFCQTTSCTSMTEFFGSDQAPGSIKRHISLMETKLAGS